MGITIHYSYKFDGDKEELIETVNAFRIWALKCGIRIDDVGTVKVWEKPVLANPQTEDARYVSEMMKWKYRLGDSQLKDVDCVMLVMDIQPGCESFCIEFFSTDGKTWKGRSFTKTHYAQRFIEAHLTVISLLDALNKAGLVEEVEDEGDYWEKRNTEELQKNIDDLDGFMERILGVLKGNGYEVVGNASDRFQ